ncbi:hypothetical protein COCOBI_11-0620 [Coccomyxa sp. Obi]|nr:hypothetical protein COCOBI_11-0620 [Coccomyxa sp. Obi]
MWELRPADSTAVTCDGCCVSLQGKQFFSPAGGGCQACYDKGCFKFDDTTRTRMGDLGIFIEPGNYYGKWPSYSAENFRGIAKPREDVRTAANNTSRMHCPGCHARIKDGSLFIQNHTETNAVLCGAEAAAQQRAKIVEQQQSCPSPGGDCARLTDKILALFRSVVNPKGKS